MTKGGEEENHYCLQVFVSLWRQIAPVESYAHIKDRNSQRYKPQARVAPAKRLSRYTEQPSSRANHQEAWPPAAPPTPPAPLASTSTRSARGWRGARLTSAPGETHVLPSQVPTGSKTALFRVLNSWSYSLAGWAAAQSAGLYKRGFRAVNKGGLTCAQWAQAQTLRLRWSRTQSHSHALPPQPSASNLTSLASTFPRLWDAGRGASASLDLGGIKWGATYKALIIRQGYNRCSMN